MLYIISVYYVNRKVGIMAKVKLTDIQHEHKQTTAILVAVMCQKDSEAQVTRSLGELQRLAETADIEVVDKVFQRRTKVDKTTYIGTGFLQELKERVSQQGIDVLIFDDELSPSQIAHIEKNYGLSVIDRTELILTIFYKHAQTAEARLEIRLAELYYEKPRLRNSKSGLDRIGGATGSSAGSALRGSGETKLELDTRIINNEIMNIKRLLQDIERQKETQAKQRADIRKVCLVGYTNAGKSTLFNTLTGADVYVQDQLFATLSSTSRKLSLFPGCDVVISDTVGFIAKLPHQLVASFTATLKEVKDADLLLHVVDVADKDCDTYITEVNKVLATIGAGDTPVLLVFNKVDKCEFELGLVTAKYPGAITVSAVNQTNIDGLLEAMKTVLFVTKAYNLRLPPNQQKVYAELHDKVLIVDKQFDDEGNMLLSIVANEELEIVKLFDTVGSCLGAT